MSPELVNTGIDVIGSVPWGTHFCQFYQTKADLRDTLVPYFKAGLENNEFCMWITAEPLSAQEARKAMRRAMPDFADRLAKGQIEILPHTDWYLKGGSFDQQRVLNGWVDKLNGALAAGYAGLRLTGDTLWLEKQDGTGFTDYETAVNEVIGKSRMLALCTYSLDKCGATEVMDVIRNHEFALVRKEGKWELVENAVYKQAKQALLESERKYRQLMENLHEGIGAVDKDLYITFVNPHMARVLGYTAEEMLGESVFKYIDESKWGATKQLMEQRPQGISENVEFELCRKDGNPLPVLISAAPLADDHGDFSGFIVGFADITGGRQAEEGLRFSEVRYRRLFETAQDGILILDGESGKIADVNAFLLKMLGYSHQDLVGKTLWEISPFKDAPLNREAFRELQKKEYARYEHLPLESKDGRRIDVEFVSNVYPVNGEKVIQCNIRDITERRRTEESLRETRDYLDNLLNYANAPIVVWNTDLRIARFNRAFQRLTGLSEDEVLGGQLELLFPEKTREESLTRIRRALAGERWEAAEIPILRVDGVVRTVLWNSATIYASDGKRAIAMIAQGQDITERKLAEGQLGFQANILSHIFDAVVVVDNDHRVTYWNKVAEELYGVPAKKAIGHKLEDLYQHAWLSPKDEQDSAEDMAAEGHWTGDNIHIKKNGERAYVRSSVSVLRNEDGMPTGIVAVIRDRTKMWQAEQEVNILNERLRQQAEVRLRATGVSFRRVIASSADGIIIVTREGIIRFVNPATEALFGRTAKEMVGTLFGFPLGERVELEILRDKGEKAVVEMRIVETDWEGSPAYLATLRDITSMKQGILVLQEGETRIRLLLDQMPCVSWTLDTKMRFTSFMGSGLVSLGILPGKILGKTVADYFKMDDSDFVAYVAHRRALQGGSMTYELERSSRTFHNRTEPLRDSEGNIIGAIGVTFDITEHKQAEVHLRNLSHRLVTAQENERRKVARELHDEVGQSLTALKLCLDRISLAQSGANGSELGVAREVLHDLVARVRSMSLELRPTMLDDLGLLPTLLWHFKRYTTQTSVCVHFRHRGLRKDLPQDTITAAYRIVQEALTNVARYAQVTEVMVCVRAEYDALIVEVEDHGVGFDLDKVAPTSTGLGGMRERALSLDGKLLVQSTPGEGTCLIAELPLAKRGRKRTRSKENDNRSSSG
jgi:PAS domain S-box-containing protein